MNISSSVLNAEQFFSVNGMALSGVVGISMGYTNPLELSPTLGNSSYGYSLNAPIENVVEFSRSLIYNDPILDFTGDLSFSGSYNYGGRSYSFESGYLTNYSVSCGVGEIPQVIARVSVYSSLRSGENNSVGKIRGGLFIPSPRSISVSGLDFLTNRVKNFSYELSVSRQPIYSIEGGKNAQAVNFISPINFSASVSIDASNSPLFNSYRIVENFSSVSLNINIKDRKNNSTVSDFTLPNPELIGETIQSNADGQPMKNLTFAGYSA